MDTTLEEQGGTAAPQVNSNVCSSSVVAFILCLMLNAYIQFSLLQNIAEAQGGAHTTEPVDTTTQVSSNQYILV